MAYSTSGAIQTGESAAYSSGLSARQGSWTSGWRSGGSLRPAGETAPMVRRRCSTKGGSGAARLCTLHHSLSSERVEIVQQAGDAGVVELVHDGAGAPRRRRHVEAADALLDAADLGRRHREAADTEADQHRPKARIPRHLSAPAPPHAPA